MPATLPLTYCYGLPVHARTDRHAELTARARGATDLVGPDAVLGKLRHADSDCRLTAVRAATKRDHAASWQNSLRQTCDRECRRRAGVGITTRAFRLRVGVVVGRLE